MADEKIVVVQGESNLVGILAIVFGVLGFFFLGILFGLITLVLTIITARKAMRTRDKTTIILAVIGGILTILDFVTSPSVWMLLGAAGMA